jgi:hypothetical protein
MDLAGQRFGRWIVLSDADPDRRGNRRVLCRCDCGREKATAIGRLRNGTSKSCGCGNDHNRKHGYATGKPAEYSTWRNMRVRCNLATNEHYPDYGGRGIKVCDRWADFLAFLQDMGPRPSSRHTIDRIDVNGNYEPGNCRWATPKEQCRNRRNNTRLTYASVTLTAVEWSEKLGGTRHVVAKRIQNGWSVERAVTTPIDVRYRKRTC